MNTSGQFKRSRFWISSLGLLFALFWLGSEKSAKAVGFGCAGVAGEVVFLDTLYGTGTGLVVSGVLEIIRDDHEDWDKRIATGAAIGAGLGLALGILEVSLRDCSESSRVNHTSLSPGLQWPRVAILTRQNLRDSPNGIFGAGNFGTGSFGTRALFDGVGAGLELKFVLPQR